MAEQWNGEGNDEVISESERENVRGRAADEDADEFDELTEDQDDEDADDEGPF